MEALIEEDAVEPSNPNFEIDQAQIGNFVNEKMRSSTCKTTKGKQCIFPWVNAGGKSISHCVAHGNKFWCGTKLKANKQYENWGWCNDDCPNSDNGLSLKFKKEFPAQKILWNFMENFFLILQFAKTRVSTGVLLY